MWGELPLSYAIGIMQIASKLLRCEGARMLASLALWYDTESLPREFKPSCGPRSMYKMTALLFEYDTMYEYDTMIQTWSSLRPTLMASCASLAFPLIGSFQATSLFCYHIELFSYWAIFSPHRWSLLLYSLYYLPPYLSYTYLRTSRHTLILIHH